MWGLNGDSELVHHSARVPSWEILQVVHVLYIACLAALAQGHSLFTLLEVCYQSCDRSRLWLVAKIVGS